MSIAGLVPKLGAQPRTTPYYPPTLRPQPHPHPPTPRPMALQKIALFGSAGDTFNVAEIKDISKEQGS